MIIPNCERTLDGKCIWCGAVIQEDNPLEGHKHLCPWIRSPQIVDMKKGKGEASYSLIKEWHDYFTPCACGALSLELLDEIGLVFQYECGAKYRPEKLNMVSPVDVIGVGG